MIGKIVECVQGARINPKRPTDTTQKSTVDKRICHLPGMRFMRMHGINAFKNGNGKSSQVIAIRINNIVWKYLLKIQKKPSWIAFFLKKAENFLFHKGHEQTRGPCVSKYFLFFAAGFY